MLHIETSLGQIHSFLIQRPKLQSDENSKSGATTLIFFYLLYGSSSDCTMIKISKISQLDWSGFQYIENNSAGLTGLLIIIFLLRT